MHQKKKKGPYEEGDAWKFSPLDVVQRIIMKEGD